MEPEYHVAPPGSKIAPLPDLQRIHRAGDEKIERATGPYPLSGLPSGHEQGARTMERPLRHIDSSSAASWHGLSQPERTAADTDVVIVGVPFDGGVGGRNGAARGPDHLRTISRRLKTISRRGEDFSDLRVKDIGDVRIERFDLPATIARIEEAYAGLIGAFSAPLLTFGGDHCVTYPIVKALARERTTGLLWFDAHPDVLDSYLGSRLSHGSPLRRIIDDGCVAPENVLLVGTRAYDEGEPAFLRERGIAEIRSAELDDGDAFSRYEQLVNGIASRVEQLYVSIDIDVLDAAVAPGTGTPVAGGLTSRMLLRLLEKIPASVRACDLVEFAPAYDSGAMTETAALAITTEVLARFAQGRATRPR
jgi:agmatinase